VFPVGDFVRALLEGRSELSSPIPLLRLLRSSPRAFVHVGRGAGRCHWSCDAPARPLVTCDGAGWLIGASDLEAPGALTISSSADVADHGFGFGFHREFHDGDAVVFAGELERAMFECCERSDLSRACFDPWTAWHAHRFTLKKHLPEFGTEYVEVLNRGERAYSRYRNRSVRNPAESVRALRYLGYGLLLCVALRAHRGDYCQ